MDMRRLAPLSPGDLPSLAQDLASSGSYRPRGTVDDAVQVALAHTIDAKVKAQLSIILEGIGDAFYALDEDWRFTYINRAAESYFMVPREQMLGKRIWEIFPGSEGTELRQRYEEIAASGVSASFEAEAVSAPGRHLEFHVFPYNRGLGVSFRDWTERRRAEEELRESQAQLSSLADNLPACMVYQISDEVDFTQRRFLYLSKTCERLTGVPAEAAQNNPLLLYGLVLPEYHERMVVAEAASHRERKAFDMEFEMRHAKSGEIRWHHLIVTPRRLSNGTYVGDGIQIDITDHKRAEEHLRLLINELNHRVKNTLATVQSLAAQSFNRPGAQGREILSSAYAAFEDRLFALARGHDVLTRENWEGASLIDVVDQAFSPYRTDPEDDCRIEIAGPDLRIAPQVALSLSMAFHELCTNALKYGALRASGGGVRITWTTATGPDGQRLAMRWQEHGGPPVSPPKRKGFGSRLIERGLARELNGTVSLSYEPSGVVCTIDVPVS
jgi:PAS domain S-box-containing protein